MDDITQPDYKLVLDFWFGSIEETTVPSEERARIWFADNPEVDQEIRSQFGRVHSKAVADKLKDWEETAHGQLALVLLFDQFSRHLFRDSPEAFNHDERALEMCMLGLGTTDHGLSLLERVFFYFPLLHSERLEVQELSLQCYNTLATLALPETTVVYDNFLRFADHHYSIIKQFGRFPQRNQVLGRESSEEELVYLKEQEER